MINEVTGKQLFCSLSFELLCMRRAVLNLLYLVARVVPSHPISHSVIWVPPGWTTLTCPQTPCWIVPQGLSVSPHILKPKETVHPNSALIPKKKWIQFLQKQNGMKIGYREGRTVVIRVLQELTIKCSVWALIRVWFEQTNGLFRQSGKFKHGIHVRWH